LKCSKSIINDIWFQNRHRLDWFSCSSAIIFLDCLLSLLIGAKIRITKSSIVDLLEQRSFIELIMKLFDKRIENRVSWRKGLQSQIVFLNVLRNDFSYLSESLGIAGDQKGSCETVAVEVNEISWDLSDLIWLSTLIAIIEKRILWNKVLYFIFEFSVLE